MTKDDLRAKIKELFSGLSDKTRENAPKMVEELIKTSSFWKEASVIGAYKADNREILLDGLIEGKKRFAFPRSTADRLYEMAEIKDFSNDFETGRFGIKEPKEECSRVEKRDIELWLVPAIAYDRNGNRLGHGGGFYDRLLEGSKGVKVGICYSFQLLDSIPSKKWDQKVNFIITEKEIINTRVN